MKIKILAEFQKVQIYNDNISVNWKLEKDSIINDDNKFHYFKYFDIDFSWDFDQNTRYIFPIFWEFSNELMPQVYKFVKSNKNLFVNKQLIPVFLDPLEGNIGIAEHIDVFSKDFNDIDVYFISGDYKLKTRNNIFKFFYVNHWQQHLDPKDSLIGYTPYKDYINLNRMPRLHRCILMQKIIDNNLLSNGYNTWALQNWKNNIYSENFFKKFNEDYPNNTINLQSYDILDVNDIGNSNPTFRIPIAHCEKTFIYLVTETHIDNKCFFISEKTYKPISIGMPFILLGNPGTLQSLREDGYATFSNWIDERYDMDLPLDERISIIINNLIKISNLHNIEKINIRRQMNEICKHNLTLYKLLNNKNNFIEILKLIEKGTV
jgi:hypothetical protein